MSIAQPSDNPSSERGAVAAAATPSAASEHLLKDSPKSFLWKLLASVVLPLWGHLQQFILHSNVVFRTIVLLLIGIAWLSWHERATVWPYLSIADNIPSALNHSQTLPVSTRQQARLDQSIREGLDKVQGFIARMSPSDQVWTLGQVTVASVGALTIDEQQLARAFASKKAGSCRCWPEYPNASYPHLNTTAWIGLALSRFSKGFDSHDVASFIQSQNSSGWWPSYLDAWPTFNAAAPYSSSFQQNASTYTTAMASLALQDMLSAGVFESNADAKRNVQNAVKSANSWLINTRVSGEARWRDYPYAASGASIQPLGLAGLVIHTLHHAGYDFPEIDRRWLNTLPSNNLTPNDFETNAYPIVLTQQGASVKDGVRHLRLPWAIIATVDTYHNGSLLERAKALDWISNLAPKFQEGAESISADMPWTSAEFMIALRYLRGDIFNGHSII